MHACTSVICDEVKVVSRHIYTFHIFGSPESYKCADYVFEFKDGLGGYRIYQFRVRFFLTGYTPCFYIREISVNLDCIKEIFRRNIKVKKNFKFGKVCRFFKPIKGSYTKVLRVSSSATGRTPS